ncbi:MAG: YybH family protein [Terriglobia bacterium]
MERRLVLTMGMAVCLAFSAGCGGPTGLSKADLAAIHQARENDVKLTKAHDWKADLALYAEDAILMPPHHAAIQGKAALQSWLEPYPQFSNFQEQNLEIDGQGNLAYDHGTYSMSVYPAGATAFEDHGKYLTLWRKQPDGAWKISRSIYNSDLAPPAPEKAKVHKKKSTTRRRARRRKSTGKTQ